MSRSTRRSTRQSDEPTHSHATIGNLLCAVIVLLTFSLLTYVDETEAHTPRPIACQFAWDAAPAGSKWRARQICLRGQARHRANHARAIAVAAAIRRCLTVRGSDMGTGLCSAIAQVRPGWADSWAYHELLRRESGWNTNAVNERSGACGSHQRLPCPWSYSGGSSSASDDRVYSTALQQARNGVRYIEARYGTPAHALAYHDSVGWY